MDIRRKIQKSNYLPTKIDTESRRDFLKTGIKAATFVAAGGVGALASAVQAHADATDDYINSQYDGGKPQKKLKYGEGLVPPGIVNMRDDAAKTAYVEVIGRNNKRFNVNGRVRKTFGSHQYTDFNVQQVNLQLAYVDPAIYVAATLIETRVNNTRYADKVTISHFMPEDLKKVNPAMFEFRKGFNRWMQTWDSNKNQHTNTEFHLSNAIFMSAYSDLRKGLVKAKEFREEHDIAKKTVLAADVTKELLMWRSPDKNSLDPSNAFNRFMVAQWASFWLSAHYDLMTKNGTYEQQVSDLIYNNIELPSGEKAGHYVRAFKGQKKYFSKSI